MASNLGDSPELEKKYDIPLSDEGSIYRLFVRGSPTPFALNEDGLDVETWIALKTGYIPRENHVFHLSDDTHSTFLKMTKKADAFVMLYIPQNPKSQKVSTMFAQLADLFSVCNYCLYSFIRMINISSLLKLIVMKLLAYVNSLMLLMFLLSVMFLGIQLHGMVNKFNMMMVRICLIILILN